MAWGMAIAGLGSLAGSVISGNSAKKAEEDAYQRQIMLNLQQQYFNQVNMQKQQEYNSKNAKTQYDRQKQLLQIENDFNEKMANQQFVQNSWLAQHAHQFEVEDLMNAGLNPILSANNGTQASVGMASSASAGADNASVGLPSSNAGSAIAFNRGELALKGIQTAIEAQAQQSTARLNSAQASKLDAETISESWRRSNLAADTDLKTSQALLTDVEKLRSEAHLPYEEKQAAADLENTLKDTILKTAEAKASLINASANSTRAGAEVLNAKTQAQAHELAKQQYNENPATQYNRLNRSSAIKQVGLGRWTGALGNIFGGNVGYTIKH